MEKKQTHTSSQSPAQGARRRHKSEAISRIPGRPSKPKGRFPKYPTKPKLERYQIVLVCVVFAIILLATTTSFSDFAQILWPGFYRFPLLGGTLLLALLPFVLCAMRSDELFLKALEMICVVYIVFFSIVAGFVVMQWMLFQPDQKPPSVFSLMGTIILLYLFYMLVRGSLAPRIKTSRYKKPLLDFLFHGSPLLLTLSVSIILMCATMVAINHYALHHPPAIFLSDKFLDRGGIPPLTVVLFYWGLVTLISKAVLLFFEQRCLTKTLFRSLLWRAVKLSKKAQGGGTSGVSQTLQMIWQLSSQSYVFLRYLSWVIPILGFIGTVLGISLAADGIQGIIGDQQGLLQVSSQLSEAIAPLGIAFDTTLIALSLSIVLTLVQTVVQRWENHILIYFEHTVLTKGIGTAA